MKRVYVAILLSRCTRWRQIQPKICLKKSSKGSVLSLLQNDYFVRFIGTCGPRGRSLAIGQSGRWRHTAMILRTQWDHNCTLPRKPWNQIRPALISWNFCRRQSTRNIKILCWFLWKWSLTSSKLGKLIDKQFRYPYCESYRNSTSQAILSEHP